MHDIRPLNCPIIDKIIVLQVLYANEKFSKIYGNNIYYFLIGVCYFFSILKRKHIGKQEKKNAAFTYIKIS
jgi:hypothetical protein